MDLRLFKTIIWRYKRLAIVGVVLAVVLAVLAYGTPELSHGKPALIPRQSPSYQATAQLLITQADNPYARVEAARLGDPGYMSSLSPIYAGIANGDSVRQAIKALKIPGTVTATEGVDPNTGAYTPFVTLTAVAPSKADVAVLVKRAITSFQGVIATMETDKAVPSSERVSLQVVDDGLPPLVVSGHKFLVPMLVFVGVLVGLITLLFSLENANPRSAARADGLNDVADFRAGARRSGSPGRAVSGSVTSSVTRTSRSNGAGPNPERPTALHPRGEQVQDGDGDRVRR